MAGTSQNHAAAVAASGQDVLSPPDALSAENMYHTENTLETSDEHDTKDATQMKDTHNIAFHDKADSMCAVLDTVSGLADPSCPYLLLIP